MTPDETTSFHKEIDLIQAVITRMAANSFAVKGWTYAITGGVLALTKDVFFKPNPGWEVLLLCLCLIVIIVAFWYLDGFFLMTEKQYRALYNWMIEVRVTGIKDHLYCLTPNDVPVVKSKIDSDPELNDVVSVMSTKTLRSVYLPLFVLMIFLAAVSFYRIQL